MAADNSERLVLLNRLAEEFAERFRDGERPSLGEYIDRHPELADDIRECFPALVEMERVKVARRKVAAPPATGPLPPLERLGDFRILREIGRGGMGVVYEAEQLSLGRHVALKVLSKRRLVDAGAKKRFEREAKAAARLHHTNIVPVFGVGEHDGLPYYAMQFIRGLGLDEVLKELRHLRPGAKGSGSTPRAPGGEPRAGRPDVSAADVARSLLAGRQEEISPRGEGGEEALASGSDATVSQAPEAAADPDLPPETSADGRLSDSSSPSLSQAVLPGSGGRPGRKQPTYWQSVARIGVQVADALEHAHRQGILHRDIKPSNLLLDTRGTVWVTDFGLAKEADDDQNLTHTGAVVGTFRYLPPEGFDGQADPRGDVYSLGLTLYELLALRPAFDERGRQQIVKQVTTTEPTPLDWLDPAVPRDLATVIHKAIAKEPGRRYQAAGELAADLQRFVDDRPILARRLGVIERASRWCRRNPLVAALTAAVAFLLIAGTAVSTYFAIDATLARDRADAEALNATNKANEALEHARSEADARNKAVAEKERADREADAAWANLYAVRCGAVQVALQNANLSLAQELLELARQPRPGRTEPPGWEWHYQWRLCHSFELRTIRGHDDWVHCTAFSPDGALLVSGSDDGTLRVWDPATGRELHRLPIKTAHVDCAAFSPDGTRLAVGGSDGRVRVFDTAHWQRLRTLAGHTKSVRGLAFSPDAAVLVSASEDHTLKLWDVAGGQELHTCSGHGDRVLCVAFSPEGQRFASGSEDRTIRLWDRSGRLVHTLHGHTSTVYGVAFSPDGRRLASGSKDWAVKVWDVPAGRELHTLTGHTRLVRSVAFSPDGTQLASASEDLTVKLWDARGAQELTTYLGHKGTVYSVAFAPDGRWVASASIDGSIRLWDPTLKPGPRTYQGHTDQVRAVGFSPDGRFLASVGLDGRIKMRDAASGQAHPIFAEAGPGLLGLAFGPDSRFLATTGDAGTVTVWETGTGRCCWSVEGHASWASSLAFSPDGQTLASGGHDDVIKLWDAVTGQERLALSGHKGEIKGLMFSADGNRLISGSEDRTLKVWNPATGELLQSLEGHTRGVTDVALSPDGRWIASASHDKTIKIWELATGREVRTLKGHNDTAWSVVFSPDGARLASAGWDRTVRVWDPVSGHELASLKGHTHRVLGVAFSPDGGRLASAGGVDLTVRVWDGRPGTDEAQTEREAVGLLDYLYTRPLRKADVQAYLRSAPALRPPVRQLALALAERYREETDPEKYHATAWSVIHHPYANVFLCRFALAQMKAACELAPEHAPYRIALGGALCRLGKFEKERYPEALATLTKCDPDHPGVLAFLAIARHQLGQAEEARIALARLRLITNAPPWAMSAEAQAFLREAEALIEGAKR
jgi:WD40 repeat protein/serine/threonine protein kinase